MGTITKQADLPKGWCRPPGGRRSIHCGKWERCISLRYQNPPQSSSSATYAFISPEVGIRDEWRTTVPSTKRNSQQLLQPPVLSPSSQDRNSPALQRKRGSGWALDDVVCVQTTGAKHAHQHFILLSGDVFWCLWCTRLENTSDSLTQHGNGWFRNSDASNFF